jgi:hypothetical protein
VDITYLVSFGLQLLELEEALLECSEVPWVAVPRAVVDGWRGERQRSGRAGGGEGVSVGRESVGRTCQGTR